MHILPIRTPVLKSGDDLASTLRASADIRDGDILVVSSKAVATCEGAMRRLDEVYVSQEAQKLAAESTGKSAAYYQAVLDETERMHGKVLQNIQGVILTELHPDGMEGTLLVPNAGLDMSNIAEGYVVGWPKDPVASCRELGKLGTGEIGVVISDSGLVPRRRGVLAFALSCYGFDPIASMIDTPDLFGQNMRVTEEAVADQLATAANMVMGNTDQSTPAAIIRDHHLPASDFCGWVPAIDREKDLFHGMI